MCVYKDVSVPMYSFSSDYFRVYQIFMSVVKLLILFLVSKNLVEITKLGEEFIQQVKKGDSLCTVCDEG